MPSIGRHGISNPAVAGSSPAGRGRDIAPIHIRNTCSVSFRGTVRGDEIAPLLPFGAGCPIPPQAGWGRDDRMRVEHSCRKDHRAPTHPLWRMDGPPGQRTWEPPNTRNRRKRGNSRPVTKYYFTRLKEASTSGRVRGEEVVGSRRGPASRSRRLRPGWRCLAGGRSPAASRHSQAARR